MKKALLSLLLFCSISAFGQIETTTSKDCYIVYDFNGKEFLKNKKIKAGSKIFVFKENNIYDSFYHIKYKNINGCIKENFITESKEIGELFEIKRKRIRLEQREKEIEDSLQVERDKKYKIESAKNQEQKKKEYGEWYFHVIAGKVAIRMPESYMLEALGKPESVTETRTLHNTYKIYEYGDKWIHVSDGKVSMIQETKR
ncbi:MAG: hypothetical protein EGQ20_07230 [Bacteroides oleiciplenus]|nr:hypothetical protein [Bacteroides oleiciplenus]